MCVSVVSFYKRVRICNVVVNFLSVVIFVFLLCQLH